MSFTARLKKRLYFTAAGYFRFFANFAFKRWDPRVIAVTGSVGKTTMLNMIEFELKKKAHYSHDANSAFGIAFDLVGLKGVTGSKLRWLYLIFAVPIRSIYYKHTEKFYIVEIDGERPHETEFLASWLKPEVTLWISLGRSHAVQFEKQVEEGQYENIDKAITHEFAMLPQYTQRLIMIDADVKLMNKAVEKIQKNHNISAEVAKFSKTDLEKYRIEPDKTKFIVKNTTFTFTCPEPRDLAIQLLMLMRLCEYLGIELKTDFTRMKLPPGRSSFFEGKDGLKIIDSSYNAHLISMQSILEMFSEIDAPHKWIVIGDIVDQGTGENKGHEQLAEIISRLDLEKVILVGRRTKKYTKPELNVLYNRREKTEKDFKRPEVFSTLSTREALFFIEQNATGKETILFKGSHYLEWIIEKLLKNPEDSKKLCRREKAAVARRKEWGLDS